MNKACEASMKSLLKLKKALHEEVTQRVAVSRLVKLMKFETRHFVIALINGDLIFRL